MRSSSLICLLAPGTVEQRSIPNLHRGIDGDSQISQNRMGYDEIECNRNKDRGNRIRTYDSQLTADRSTTELLRNKEIRAHIGHGLRTGIELYELEFPALILDWRGHQRPLPFHPLDRWRGGQSFWFFHVVKELNKELNNENRWRVPDPNRSGHVGKRFKSTGLLGCLRCIHHCTST
ncbi:hypothetical protein Lal_00044975 [Lupinus albus]|nr:hypothetical protein Lal_00044975 [Lupinus albus]